MQARVNPTKYWLNIQPWTIRGSTWNKVLSLPLWWWYFTAEKGPVCAVPKAVGVGRYSVMWTVTVKIGGGIVVFFFLCASLCLFPVKGASYTLTAFSESNHTNLIRVVCPRSCSRCWAAVRPLFPYLPRRKLLTCTSSLWTDPFFSSPLTSFTTLFWVSLPPS